jgi:methyltransferase (TIGR00027 family)
MTETPSRTSIWAAAARAIGSRYEDSRYRNPDLLADKLIGPAERDLIMGHPLSAALLSDAPENRANPEVMGATMTMIVRTKFVDEKLEAAVRNGATQFVILGAGWDTRAYRMPELLRDVRIFEIDQPPTQNWKRRRAVETLGPPPPNVTYLPIDFRTQTPEQVLATAGYDPKQKTFFLWEGVTMYLPEQAIKDVFQWISRQAPGSTLVFDFAYQSTIDFFHAVKAGRYPLDNEFARVGYERLLQLEAWGEPWLFGIPDGNAEKFITDQGLVHRETIAMASTEAAKRYLGWDRPEPFPASIRQTYAIAEAGVA